MSTAQTVSEPHSENRHDEIVSVTIDNDRTVDIAVGQYSVTDLKIKLSVPVEYVLEVIEHEHFRTIEDNSHFHIRGGEQFLSHVRCGGSS